MEKFNVVCTEERTGTRVEAISTNGEKVIAESFIPNKHKGDRAAAIDAEIAWCKERIAAYHEIVRFRQAYSTK